MIHYNGNDYFLEDINPLFKIVNSCFYDLISEMGLEIDFSKKDQQKIYTHFFIKTLCERLQNHSGKKTIYYINLMDVCNIHHKIIKKVIKIFGFRLYTHYYSMDELLVKIHTNDCKTVDEFETFLNKQSNPSSFKKIKKYLNNEGMINLSDTYFQDIANKIAIMC